MHRSMTNFFTGMREGWAIARPYFSSEERFFAIGMLAVIIALNLLMVFINVVFTYWSRDFFNAIQAYDAKSVIHLIYLYARAPGEPYPMPGFIEIAIVYILIYVYSTYLNQMLQIRWRQWLTGHFVKNWLADRAYYHISLNQGASSIVDNPDQRISEDLNSFTNNTLALGLNFISNVVTLLSFIFVLYAISGSVKVLGITIHGYMVYVAILYSVFGTLFTHLIGRKLVPLTFNQQRVEANFRYGLIRVRENPEAVALYGGENEEQTTLHERFQAVFENFWAIMRRTKALNFFTAGFNQVANVFPLLVALPRYFSHQIALGGLTQITSVFGQVQGAFSWFVSSYQSLVTWRATVSRLNGFQEAVSAARLAASNGPRHGEPGAALMLNNLTLTLPDGRRVLDNASLSLPPGQPITLTGASGIGKSTLFRAIAGIWPFGEGEITPPTGTILFLPQRPYFPLGSLKRSVVYPAQEQDFSDDTVRAALEAVELDGMASRLHDTANWVQILSGGEQQRLALARALLIKPDWLFLDEATSALDAPLTERIQAVLVAKLPNTTIVSITHRDLAGQAQRHLALAGGALAPVGTPVA